ncbi:hypothetical protein RUND412_002784 [Rhizina undulata]
MFAMIRHLHKKHRSPENSQQGGETSSSQKHSHKLSRPRDPVQKPTSASPAAPPYSHTPTHATSSFLKSATPVTLEERHALKRSPEPLVEKKTLDEKGEEMRLRAS